jgi:hypothetical protein
LMNILSLLKRSYSMLGNVWYQYVSFTSLPASWPLLPSSLASLTSLTSLVFLASPSPPSPLSHP